MPADFTDDKVAEPQPSAAPQVAALSLWHRPKAVSINLWPLPRPKAARQAAEPPRLAA